MRVSALRLNTPGNDSRISKTVHIDNGLGKSLRSCLRQSVPDASSNGPVCMFAGEFLCKRTGVRIMWCPISVAFKSDGRHGDRLILLAP